MRQSVRGGGRFVRPRLGNRKAPGYSRRDVAQDVRRSPTATDNLETERTLPDRRLARAARSLHRNRRLQLLIEDRIGRARDTLYSHLALYGLAAAKIGAYEVSLDGQEIQVTPLPASDSNQLPLPQPTGTDRPENGLQGTLNGPLDDPSPLAQYDGEGYLGWTNRATFIAYESLSSNAQLSSAAERAVAEAGDIDRGGDALRHLLARSEQLGGPDVTWAEIAWWFAPPDWEDPVGVDWFAVQDADDEVPESRPLAASDLDLLTLAHDGELPCPRCTAPLSAEPLLIDGRPEVRLFCRKEGCGFEEF